MNPSTTVPPPNDDRVTLAALAPASGLGRVRGVGYLQTYGDRGDFRELRIETALLVRAARDNRGQRRKNNQDETAHG